MSGNFIKLYAVGAAVDSAFFLDEGSVYFYASAADKYAITGKNLIIGSTEIIMKHYGETDTSRVETAVTDGASMVKKISIEKFLEGLSGYSFAMNASMVLAKQVLLTNQIIQKNITVLEGDEKKTKEYTVEYYTIVHRLQKEYDKRRLPWLKVVVDEFTHTLTYKKGEAYYKSSEPVRITTADSLSNKDVEFKRGDVICAEDTEGTEMYILKSGSLDVVIQGNKVASIDEQGTVIGEMALLLGEKRTATLTAKNNVIITKIRKEDLKEVAEKQPDFLSCIAETLAKRHFYNIAKISHINKSIAEQAIDREAEGQKPMLHSLHAHKDLSNLKNRIEEVSHGKNVDFLRDLIDTF